MTSYHNSFIPTYLPLHQCPRLQGKKCNLISSTSKCKYFKLGHVEMPVPGSGSLNVHPSDAVWLEFNNCLPPAVKQGPQSCQML